MSGKRPAHSGNPDLRRAMQVPGPPIEEIEAKLLYWLTPESFKPLRLTPGSQKLRDRLLTLPVMMAVFELSFYCNTVQLRAMQCLKQ